MRPIELRPNEYFKWVCDSVYKCSHDGRDCRRTDLDPHLLLDAGVDEETAGLIKRYLSMQAKWNESGPSIYVRLGTLPVSGKSKNYRDGGYEAGVSCFEARMSSDQLLVRANAGAILFDQGRDLYQIDGDLLTTTGSDDEPLLANAKIVQCLNKIDWVLL